MAQADLIDSATGIWNPPDDYRIEPAQPAGNGVAPTAGNQRESFHYDRIPDAYRNIPGFTDWANNPNIDPGAEAQKYLQSQRSAGRTDETDAAALTGAGYLGGRAPAPPTQAQRAPSLAAGVPNQFDDPYTNLLESISKSQMGEIRSNPAFDQLTSYLQSQFNELSTAPGFSPAEMAMLNTQAFEPIEELRKGAQERSLQRTASRGFLPSSGLAELDARNIDQDFDKMRTVANRDLAIQGIDRRDSDLARAGQIAQSLGLTIPQGQRSEELNLANLLYGLPRNALMDALAVVNGSPVPGFQGAALLQQQQQYEQQQQAELWSEIAKLLAGIV